MRVLVTGANGKTGSHVLAAFRALPQPPTLRAISRRPVDAAEDLEVLHGDLEDPAVRARAVADMDAIIYYGPAMHPREVAMGTGMIDAAVAAGVRRFIFISVIHPQIEDLLNHKAKLAIEAYLINSGLDWTILRPQHYMQNIDVRRVVAEGSLTTPYPVDTRLGHVDMADLAEAAAKVTVEPGHSFASYDIASDQHLSVEELSAAISSASGRAIEPRAIPAEALVDLIGRAHPLSNYSIEAFHRLFGYYARRGIWGNSNVLTWLLGRPAGSFEAYVRRSLAGLAGKVGNAG